MALYQSVADTIGNTPLVRIKNFEKANDLEANVYAKLSISIRQVPLKTESQRQS